MTAAIPARTDQAWECMCSQMANASLAIILTAGDSPATGTRFPAGRSQALDDGGAQVLLLGVMTWTLGLPAAL